MNPDLMVFILEIICLKKKNRTYIRNLDEYADASIHWIALFCKINEILYFNSFGVEHVPEDIKKFIENKNIISNIFRWCVYFYIGFIDFMSAGKKLADFTSMFSPHESS